ncbi:MAG: large conductance mechanosensitive channel protein MscL [Euryarchaeota archaeon]|nr:large conductance mechanosensitive channel protein MscL [Euryarchaeota archaeon]MDE1836338.1 large conductance mechanosensitive channel protein MscL [Euryarchaeota archaeon]MDE1879136.1 large conductance mechanosensitive channel protein MscL [Euryarchaeota archaeon]MDE2044266.1 large conductance mechanosensitive channel protein MscL [Thermoplasmata archaeon]
MPKVPKVPIPKVKLLDEFRSFITKGNVIDMAVGIVIGLAFGAVVNGMVGDVVTPMIAPATGAANFGSWYVNVTYAHNATGVPEQIHFALGALVNVVISFVLIALVVFLLIVKPMATMKARQEAKKPKPEVTTKECPYCISEIPLKATRCKYCASDMDTAVPPKLTEKT